MEHLLFTNVPGPRPAESWSMANLLLRPLSWSQDVKTRIRRIIEPLNEDDPERLSNKIYMPEMNIFFPSDGLRRLYVCMRWARIPKHRVRLGQGLPI